MGQMITKPDANPILFAICNWFGLGALGYFLMGQQKKAILAAVITVVLSTVTCGMGGLVVFVFVYDAYLLGQKLQSGQSIGINENGLEFLNSIFKD
jgi:hypothetical protein